MKQQLTPIPPHIKIQHFPPQPLPPFLWSRAVLDPADDPYWRPLGDGGYIHTSMQMHS